MNIYEVPTLTRRLRGARYTEMGEGGINDESIYTHILSLSLSLKNVNQFH